MLLSLELCNLLPSLFEDGIQHRQFRDKDRDGEAGQQWTPVAFRIRLGFGGGG